MSLYLLLALAVLLFLIEFVILNLHYRRLLEGRDGKLAAEQQSHQSDLIRFEEYKLASQRQFDEYKESTLRQLHDQKMEYEQRRKEDIASLQKAYEENLKLFRNTVQANTEELLKQRSAELQTANTHQMETLFKPLRDNIQHMEQSMKENRDVQTSTNASLKEAMKQMMERTNEIGTQADRLSNALQHKNKTMGNWGELVLTQLLESQGLRNGKQFDVQQTLRDEAGRTLLHEESNKRMVPDVILHLADNRDVIIDAKVSLTAFVDYTNATTEEERAEATARHLQSIRGHVKELSRKDYSSYIVSPRVSSDFVIMFVPNEGALQLMMATEPGLWDEAFNNDKVFIVGGQNLVAALHIIDLTWRQFQQERNTQKIMEEARKLVDRVGQFYEKYKDLGSKLASVTNAYNELESKAISGRQSILSSGQKIEDLGVKGKKALPTEVTE